MYSVDKYRIHCCIFPSSQVSTDSNHTIRVWDMYASPIVMVTGMQTNGYNGDPPKVFGLTWNPLQHLEGAHFCDFVTFGVVLGGTLRM